MCLRDDRIDEIDLGGKALEEQVAVRRVHVRLDVDLRQVRLAPHEVFELGICAINDAAQTCMMVSNSRASRASIFLTSKSMCRAWFLDAADWSLRLRDIMFAVWEAAVADSCCAVCVSVRRLSSSL